MRKFFGYQIEPMAVRQTQLTGLRQLLCHNYFRQDVYCAKMLLYYYGFFNGLFSYKLLNFFCAIHKIVIQ